MVGGRLPRSFSRSLQNMFLFIFGVQASWYYAAKGLAVNPGDTVRSLHKVNSRSEGSMESLEKAKKLAAFTAVDDFVKVNALRIDYIHHFSFNSITADDLLFRYVAMLKRLGRVRVHIMQIMNP